MPTASQASTRFTNLEKTENSEKKETYYDIQSRLNFQDFTYNPRFKNKIPRVSKEKQKMQSARLAYNGEVPESLSDAKIDNFQIGTYDDRDFLEKLNPLLIDIVREYSESNFDLF